MSKICKAEGCDRPAMSTGWCSTHHSRYYRNGDVNTIKRTWGTGAKDKKEYNNYSAMMQRCYYKKGKAYRNYGGRGIKVCDRWREKPYGFWNFYKDMGPKPGSEYSLDRIDIDGDYCPENCRWATRIEQNSNRRFGKKDSKCPGVWKFNEKYWCASIGKNGKTIIKYAKTEKEAIAKRRQLLEKYYPRISS